MCYKDLRYLDILKTIEKGVCQIIAQKILVLMDPQPEGGSAYVEAQISRRLLNKFGDNIKVAYKINDWSYIDKMLNELKNDNIKMIFDLNYWPINYHQIKFFKNNFKINNYHILLDHSYYYSRKLKVRSALLLQAMGLHASRLGIPYNLIKYLKIRKNFPIDIFLSTRNKPIYIL